MYTSHMFSQFLWVRSVSTAELGPLLRAIRGCHQVCPERGSHLEALLGKDPLAPLAWLSAAFNSLQLENSWQPASSKPARKTQQDSRASPLAGQSLTYHNVIMDGTSQHHCHILLVRNKSQVLPTPMKQCLYKTVNTQRRTVEPPESLSATKIIMVFTRSQW